MVSAAYKVLLVDDDPSLLRLLGRWLAKAGHRVSTAADGQEALAAVEADCPDFLITDWEMPRLNGLELCRRMRATSLPHYVYIVFLTAKTGTQEMIAGLEGGADDFLTKPLAEAELLARLRAGSRVLELVRELNLMARTDSLTGLLTQRSFYDCLNREWGRSARLGLPMSCVMMDLDFFKQINDVHGHPMGDSVLRLVAELLLDNSRGSDTVCRYGGEEFCALLPETGECDAALWAERVRARLRELRIPADVRDLRVSASFGVAERHDGLPEAEALVKLADNALLCAKRAGRDRVVRHTSALGGDKPRHGSTDWHDDVFNGMLARDVMSPLVTFLQEENTIDDAVRLFLQSGILCVPVLNAAGALAGFVSERDLLGATASADRWQQPLSTVMRPNVICYEEETPIRPIYEFLCRIAVRGVVITKSGQPTGIVNRSSLLRCFRDWSDSRGLSEPLAAIPTSPGRSTPGTAFAPILHSPDSAWAAQPAV